MLLTRFHKVLLGLLAVQLLLVVFIGFGGDSTAPATPQPLLAGFDAAKVTRIQIFAADGKLGVDLAKRGDAWAVTSAFDYPAETTKVTDFLSPLAKLMVTDPLATSATRHKQLHVADDQFERKLVLTADGKDTVLVVGNPAGARRHAVRIGGAAQVFGVNGLAAHSIGTEPSTWVSTKYLEIPQAEIAKVTVQRDGKTIELARNEAPPPAPAGTGSGSAAGSGAGSAAPAGPAWLALIDRAPLAFTGGDTLDVEAIERVLGQLATIELAAVGDPKRDASKPTATVTIERKASGTSAAPTVLDLIADGERFWLKDRANPRAILVDKGRFESLVTLDRDKLTKRPAPPAPQAPPGPPAAHGGMPMPPGMPPG